MSHALVVFVIAMFILVLGLFGVEGSNRPIDFLPLILVCMAFLAKGIIIEVRKK